MKKFLFNIVFISVPLVVATGFLICSMDGYADPFYIRFTTPRQSSLIIGTSRAAQGIQPQIINKILGRKDLFNYAFTRNDSPYGPTYLNSIKEKLNPKTKNGIFILAVDSWSLSSDSPDPNDVAAFEELHSSLARTTDVNTNPNLSYLLNSFNRRQLLLRQKKVFLHQNGWLEVMTDDQPSEAYIQRKVQDYKKNIFPYYKYSEMRFKYLIETIKYLKPFGKVYVVRLPIHPEMMKLDTALIPNLDTLARTISDEYNVPYLNLTSKNTVYQYTDGNHLYKKSSEKVSREIAEWILNQ